MSAPVPTPFDTPSATPFVSSAALGRALREGRAPVLLDVRHTPRRGADRDAYARGHLPGAVFVDLPAELASPGGGPGGRLPLPEPGALQAAARRWGVGAGSDVVVYDERSGLSAARAWWLLRWAGHARVRILDGGLAAWRAAGGELTADEPVVTPGDLVVEPGRLPVVDIDEAAERALRGLLFDARRAEDHRGGHIPGAHSTPAGRNLTPEGTLLPADELRSRYADAERASSGGPLAVHCGSGVSATFQIAVLASLGIDAALFPGSWSAWSADPDRPVATDAGDAADAEAGGTP
ncbi:sulfurtransferase [Streptomyces radicis]|uniref:Sulfurtransferase n=1 Tax=Streptomyces radicis TaxID=1750517 RepID=A0A3A9WIB8_9ACTN|nr:rhodanese-like domain-containing protein [Streptomyces radicis]RKN12519.1 sulfurtransferase [Streptomyces radicis]RKN27715.1 sulfurtransferase [Streptomyces radicis]